MIAINNISFDYPITDEKTRTVLKNISLEIKEGESITVMGPNGSGKTTFARCLNGLLIPSKGKVIVDGLPTSEQANLTEIRRRVGMVFQNPDNQIVSATVEREIAFGLENLGKPYDEMHRIVDEMLEKFHLQQYRKRAPHYLSGGEKQKLAMAAVLAMRPSYLILDEPTSLLDPQSRKDILQLVRQFHSASLENDNSSITTIFITQFAEEALSADRLIIFYDGRIFMDGAPEKVFSNIKPLLEIGLEPPVKILMQNLVKRTSR
ncbi:MAG: ATP-binding cassette domain-containing protein [Calditrichaeota bacterium]|nr:ATP-binding cassette domain-containing protein [Calditrichota bacterium]